LFEALTDSSNFNSKSAIPSSTTSAQKSFSTDCWQWSSNTNEPDVGESDPKQTKIEADRRLEELKRTKQEWNR